MTVARRKKVALRPFLVVVAVSAGVGYVSSKLDARGGVDDWRSFLVLVEPQV